MSNSLILIIVLPLLGAFLTHLTKYTKLKRGAEIVAFTSMGAALFILLSMSSAVMKGKTIQYSLGAWPAPIGISLALDGLSFFFSLLILGTGLLIILYSLGIYIYARRYYSLLLIAFSGLLGVVLTRDIFNMYVFFEVLAVASYVLITYKRKPRAVSASFKYLIMTESAWVLFLLAIAILYALTGTLNMDGISLQMGKIYQNNPGAVYLILSMMMIAFGIKCGMFPLHTWIPDAHSQAPTPVSGLLSGLILKVGIYAMLRIFFLFFGAIPVFQVLGKIILYLGVITLILGACLALVEDELKKLLAYSSVNQIGFILVGVGLGTRLGLSGGLFHIMNHAIIKTALFFCAGIIISQTGFWKISQLKGIWRKMPAAAFAFTILALAVIGIPPFNGFVSKFFILDAVVKEGNFAIVFIMFLGILLSAAYYFRIVQIFFAREESKERRDFVPLPVGPFEHFSAYVFVGLALFIGIFPVFALNIIEPAMKVFLK